MSEEADRPIWITTERARELFGVELNGEHADPQGRFKVQNCLYGPTLERIWLKSDVADMAKRLPQARDPNVIRIEREICEKLKASEERRAQGRRG